MSTPLRLTRDVVLGGDFRILTPLGAGGMGAVYTAEQLSTGRRRAVKVMHPLIVEDDKQRQRFAREARIGARIVSDHVVDVIAAGVDAELGIPWIAMELLEGDDLGEHLVRRGAQGLGQVVEHFRQLCHALGAAHRAGIVHRDVKPQNIFVSATQTPTAPTTIKVLDFGIAKVAAVASAAGTAMVGSPAWMAPEQTDPLAPITPAADVWALGLLAFWMLTGASFWHAANSSQASLHALMKEVLFDVIPPASERAAEYGRAARLPEGFDPWFARCVDREAPGRFTDATELYDALEKVARDAPSIGTDGNDGGAGLAATDVATMSTRCATDSATLDAVANGAAALSTRSFVESSDLDVPLSRPGEAAVTEVAPDSAPSDHAAAETLARAATLDAATATIGSTGGPTDQPRSRASWPQAARYAVGSLALIAVVAGALVVGMRLESRRPGEETRAASSTSQATPSATSARGSTSAPSSRPGAGSSGAVASIPGMTPVTGADRFDPTAGFATAQRIARANMPDAELVWFTAQPVSDAGFINLLSKGSASYMFRSATGESCYSVSFTQVGRYDAALTGESCLTQIVGLPKCSVTAVIRRAKGNLELTGSPPSNVSFGWLRTKGRAGWFVKSGGLERTDMVDDCP